MDPIKPTNWNPSEDCSFLKIPCACHNVVFVIECYVLNVHFRLVIEYIYFTTILKNGWMENKEISFFNTSLVYCRIVLLLLLERDKTLLYTVMKQFLPMYPFQLYCFFNRHWSLVTFSQNRYWDALKTVVEYCRRKGFGNFRLTRICMVGSFCLLFSLFKFSCWKKEQLHWKKENRQYLNASLIRSSVIFPVGGGDWKKKLTLRSPSPHP